MIASEALEEKQCPAPSPHPHLPPQLALGRPPSTPGRFLPLPSLPVPSFLTFLFTLGPESPELHSYFLSLFPLFDKNMETQEGESICPRPHFHYSTSIYGKLMPGWLLLRQTNRQTDNLEKPFKGTARALNFPRWWCPGLGCS